MIDTVAITDYKKWLLYSLDTQEWETYYQLFKALKTGESVGNIKITRPENTSGQFVVSAQGIQGELHITDEQRKSLISYLIKNYFHTEDVDEVMLQKQREKEKANNHAYVNSNGQLFTEPKKDFAVRQHPKESLYFNIKLVVSIIFYMAVAGAIAYGIVIDMAIFFSILIAIGVILVLKLFNAIWKGIIIGIVKGNSIRLTREQYPEVFNIIEQQAQQLKVKNLPEIYILSGPFNALVTRFSRAYILLIGSEVIETALKGNYDVLKYVTAHELCHIKQKHLTKEKFLSPSALIPFLGLAYSRGCEYTCDRTGYDFSPKGSVEGILIMTTGKEIHSKFNIDLHIKNSKENEDFWTWLGEKFLTHPHLYKRLIEIKKYSQH